MITLTGVLAVLGWSTVPDGMAAPAVPEQDGRTMVRLATEDGTATYTQDDALIAASGTEFGVSFGMDPDDEDADHSYSATVRAPEGSVLRPGTYPVTSQPFATIASGLLTSSRVGLCAPGDGTITVHEAAYDDRSGDLERLLVTWEQTCWDGPPGGLQGTFAWHALGTPPPPVTPARWRGDPVDTPSVVASIGGARLDFTPPTGISLYSGRTPEGVAVRYREGSRPMTAADQGRALEIRRNLSNIQYYVQLDRLQPGTDYTVSFFVTPDRTPRPAPTTVTLRGTTTALQARRLRSGATRVTGRVTDSRGAVAGAPVFLDVHRARGGVEKTTTTTSRDGRFTVRTGRAVRVDAVYTGFGARLGSLTTATVRSA